MDELRISLQSDLQRMEVVRLRHRTREREREREVVSEIQQQRGRLRASRLAFAATTRISSGRRALGCLEVHHREAWYPVLRCGSASREEDDHEGEK